MNKALYAYTTALYGLAHSGQGLEKPAREQAVQLLKSVEALNCINTEQSKLVDYFAKLTRVTSDNFSTEKDRLKQLLLTHSKKEKHLVKEVNKKLKVFLSAQD